MINAVIMEPFTKEDKIIVSEGFEDKYNFTFCEGQIPGEILKEAEVIIGQASLEIVHNAPKLKWLQGAFAGVDNLLKQGEFPKEVILTNVTGAFGKSIAEHMLSMILMMYKKLDKYYLAMKSKAWDDLGRENTLFGKNVLIIGAGDIGSTFAKLLVPFDTYTVGIRRSKSDVSEGFNEMHTMDKLDKASLKDLISQADIIAVSLPSTDATRGLLDYELLSAMKEDAMFVNVGRGDTVVTKALIQVLGEKKMAGACLDVVYPEPLPADSPLWDMDNVLITPHVSGGSFGHLQLTTDKLNSICRENLKRYAAGETLINRISLKEGYVK